MKVGDLVQTIPSRMPMPSGVEDNRRECSWVGIIMQIDGEYFAEGITGESISLVQVLFASEVPHPIWVDSDQIEPVRK